MTNQKQRRIKTDQDLNDFVDYVYYYTKYNKNLTWRQLCEGLKDGQDHRKEEVKAQQENKATQ